MNINVRKTGPWAPESFTWIGSRHGIDSTQTITLNPALFATNFTARGYVPGGVALGKVTATGLYGPYDNTANDGRETCVGFLFGSKSLTTGAAALGAALVVHGTVREANLPLNHGIDAAGKTDLAGRFSFI